MFKFLRKKTIEISDLERAKKDKLISDEEFWEIIIKRAEKELKKLKEKKK